MSEILNEQENRNKDEGLLNFIDGKIITPIVEWTNTDFDNKAYDLVKNPSYEGGKKLAKKGVEIVKESAKTAVKGAKKTYEFAKENPVALASTLAVTGLALFWLKKSFFDKTPEGKQGKGFFAQMWEKIGWKKMGLGGAAMLLAAFTTGNYDKIEKWFTKKIKELGKETAKEYLEKILGKENAERMLGFFEGAEDVVEEAKEVVGEVVETVEEAWETAKNKFKEEFPDLAKHFDNIFSFEEFKEFVLNNKGLTIGAGAITGIALFKAFFKKHKNKKSILIRVARFIPGIKAITTLTAGMTFLSTFLAYFGLDDDKIEEIKKDFEKDDYWAVLNKTYEGVKKGIDVLKEKFIERWEIIKTNIAEFEDSIGVKLDFVLPEFDKVYAEFKKTHPNIAEKLETGEEYADSLKPFLKVFFMIFVAPSLGRTMITNPAGVVALGSLIIAFGFTQDEKNEALGIIVEKMGLDRKIIKEEKSFAENLAEVFKVGAKEVANKSLKLAEKFNGKINSFLTGLGIESSTGRNGIKIFSLWIGKKLGTYGIKHKRVTLSLAKISAIVLAFDKLAEVSEKFMNIENEEDFITILIQEADIKAKKDIEAMRDLWKEPEKAGEEIAKKYSGDMEFQLVIQGINESGNFLGDAFDDALDIVVSMASDESGNTHTQEVMKNFNSLDTEFLANFFEALYKDGYRTICDKNGYTVMKDGIVCAGGKLLDNTYKPVLKLLQGKLGEAFEVWREEGGALIMIVGGAIGAGLGATVGKVGMWKGMTLIPRAQSAFLLDGVYKLALMPARLAHGFSDLRIYKEIVSKGFKLGGYNWLSRIPVIGKIVPYYAKDPHGIFELFKHAERVRLWHKTHPGFAGVGNKLKRIEKFQKKLIQKLHGELGLVHELDVDKLQKALSKGISNELGLSDNIIAKLGGSTNFTDNVIQSLVDSTGELRKSAFTKGRIAKETLKLPVKKAFQTYEKACQKMGRTAMTEAEMLTRFKEFTANAGANFARITTALTIMWSIHNISQAPKEKKKEVAAQEAAFLVAVPAAFKAAQLGWQAGSLGGIYGKVTLAGIAGIATFLIGEEVTKEITESALDKIGVNFEEGSTGDKVLLFSETLFGGGGLLTYGFNKFSKTKDIREYLSVSTPRLNLRMLAGGPIAFFALKKLGVWNEDEELISHFNINNVDDWNEHVKKMIEESTDESEKAYLDTLLIKSETFNRKKNWHENDWQKIEAYKLASLTDEKEKIEAIEFYKKIKQYDEEKWNDPDFLLEGKEKHATQKTFLENISTKTKPEKEVLPAVPILKSLY